jgi:ABC-type antimicrobial peptide transport system permease subunit
VGVAVPQVYQPATQAVTGEGVFASVGELNAIDGWVVLRTLMLPEQVENTVRATLRQIDPQLPLYQMQTMEHAISKSDAPRRFNTVLVSSFAGPAVLLSVLGVYAVIAFSVALRRQEMAVRMAFGCQRSKMVMLILDSAAKLASVGCGLGFLGIVAADHLPRSFLFGVSPLDPGVLSLVRSKCCC